MPDESYVQIRAFQYEQQEDFSYTFEPVEMKLCEEELHFKGAENRGDLEGFPAMCVDTE